MTNDDTYARIFGTNWPTPMESVVKGSFASDVHTNTQKNEFYRLQTHFAWSNHTYVALY